MSDELMDAFIEDSKEHLESIESDIMALEDLEGAYDEELINRIFRTAHSIKGAAGFFGLETIGSLAHKLENALHLMRDQKLRPDRPTCQILLEGFDQLNAMINDPGNSECLDISDILSRIQGLLTPETKLSTETAMSLPSTQGQSIFDVDMFTLEQGLKGGKFLYHIEFDLIHDIHRKDKTPYDTIKTLQDSGLILDCKVDFEATGTLEDGFAQRIPLNVLFATIIDPDVVGTLIDVPAERIRELEKSMFQIQSPPSETVPETCSLSADPPWKMIGGQAVLVFGERFELSQVEEFRNCFHAAPAKAASLRLDLSATRYVDAAGLQALVSALKTSARLDRGLTFAPADELLEQFQNLGFAWMLESGS
ncbi:Hpt domain-containing protein [Desulfonatronum thiodismutans]|uniref:Hpt domain-containing protein n=1 Tax=Desulfonatronum thiodismutans TaxID=159290 RepID=UPI0004ABE8B8|nr:Hpt domain-containing protein [Desulfonatronum thiodismutans]